MNSVQANKVYTSAYGRIAYTQTRAICPHTKVLRTLKHGLLVRIRTNSVDVNTSYLSAGTQITVFKTRVIRPHTHE